ncbi:MAG: HDOD domain-containing protein [Myxococcales bacterium FL481]|nr:MAG: HDOD domain-containing protein [Myxococcales bacterium FL481]
MWAGVQRCAPQFRQPVSDVEAMSSAASNVPRRVYLRPDEVSHEIDESATQADSAEARANRVRQIAREAVTKLTDGRKPRLPMLPNVAARAMEVAGNPDVTVRELEALIQPDPMLTARIMSIANSPLYGRGGAIRSLRNAVMQLGVGLMRDVLYQSVAEAHIFRGSAEARLRRERLHAVAVGYLAREVFTLLGIGTEYAFLCGLMHDVGRPLIWQFFEETPPAGASDEDMTMAVEMTHPHVGAAVIDHWRLPALVKEAVRRHHKYRDFDDGTGYAQVGHAVAAAERVAAHVGLADDDRPQPISEAGDQVLGELGLHGDALAPLLQRAEDLQRELSA